MVEAFLRRQSRKSRSLAHKRVHMPFHLPIPSSSEACVKASSSPPYVSGRCCPGPQCSPCRRLNDQGADGPHRHGRATLKDRSEEETQLTGHADWRLVHRSDPFASGVLLAGREHWKRWTRRGTVARCPEVHVSSSSVVNAARGIISCHQF